MELQRPLTHAKRSSGQNCKSQMEFVRVLLEGVRYERGFGFALEARKPDQYAARVEQTPAEDEFAETLICGHRV